MDPLEQHGAYAFVPYLPSTTASRTTPDPSSFKIKHTSSWTYSGPLLTPTHLPPSLHTWSSAAVSSSPALLQRLIPLLVFLEDFLPAAGVQHYWLTLRATTPTHEYDMPRWHVDDDFFSPVSRTENVRQESRKKAERKDKKTGWKLCTSLLGPSTLFLSPSANADALQTLRSTQKSEAAGRNHVCTSIRCAGCFDTGEAVRRSLATAFAGKDVVQAGYGEVAVFRIGGEEGAVHSEPPCGVDRVFVNVVPGTEEGLRTLMGRYGMEFPRAWSLGVPVRPDCLEGLQLEDVGERVGRQGSGGRGEGE